MGVMQVLLLFGGLVILYMDVYMHIIAIANFTYYSVVINLYVHIPFLMALLILSKINLAV